LPARDGTAAGATQLVLLRDAVDGGDFAGPRRSVRCETELHRPARHVSRPPARPELSLGKAGAGGLAAGGNSPCHPSGEHGALSVAPRSVRIGCHAHGFAWACGLTMPTQSGGHGSLSAAARYPLAVTSTAAATADGSPAPPAHLR